MVKKRHGARGKTVRDMSTLELMAKSVGVGVCGCRGMKERHDVRPVMDDGKAIPVHVMSGTGGFSFTCYY